MSDVRTMLVVDSDAATQEALGGLLTPPEWRVEGARDGQEGLALLCARYFDVAVIDLAAPGMGGIDLLTRVWQARPATRVIVLSAEEAPSDVVRSVGEYAFSYFSKPFDPRALAEMARRAAAATNWQDGIEVLSARPEWISLRLRCQILTADRLLQFCHELRMELPGEVREEIATAFREVLLNAIEHGGHFNRGETVRVSRFRVRRAVIYLIQDPGAGFSLDNLPHAAISNPPGAPARHMLYRTQQGMRAGGFGLLLAKNMVDEMIHNERGNEVVLVKYLEE
jgi:DNA-binding response OmpR family regulator